MTTTADSLRLRALADRVAGALVAATAPRAVLLAGSAGEGTADRLSDLDLMVYYERLPDPAAFRAVLAGLGAEQVAPIGPETQEFFADSYLLDGVEVQTGGTAVAEVERALDRVLSATDPGEPRTKVVMGLLHGRPLHGPDLVARWRGRAAYPDALAVAMVARHLRVFPLWQVREQLAARDAVLFEVQSLLDGAFQVLGALSGLNRVYFTTFQFKRMRQHVSVFRSAPPRLAERLESLFQPDRARAAEELRSLVEETVALVEAAMPEVDTSAVRRSLPR